MENIITLIAAIGVLALVCIGIVALLYPIMFDIAFRQNTGQKGISYGWAVLQIIGIFGMMSNVQEDSVTGFIEAVIFTVIVFVIAMLKNYKRIKRMGMDKSLCRHAVLAQATAPIGIVAILLFVSSIFDNRDEDKGK